jgi:CDP-paratose 2-epimerase
VLAGSGQFGRPDQGIFAYWLNSWCRNHPLKYIGFDGMGHQVRDCLHPEDLVSLMRLQLAAGVDPSKPCIVNLAGGIASAISLRQLSAWCAERWGQREVQSEPQMRPFDIPWMVLDSGLAQRTWNWTPVRKTVDILEEIAQHAEANPNWLDISAPL